MVIRVPYDYVPRSQSYRYRFGDTISNILKNGVYIGISNNQAWNRHATSRSYKDYLEFYYARKKIIDGDRLD